MEMTDSKTNTSIETVEGSKDEKPPKSSTTAEKVRSLQKSLSEVLETVAESVKKLIIRGENLDDLEEQTELLKQRAESFDHYAGRLLIAEQKKHRKNKLILMGALGISTLLVVFVVLYLVGVF